MASINAKAKVVANQPRELTPYEELYRSVMCCLLWEDSFYENGESISDRFRRLIPLVSNEQIQWILNEAKFSNKLRHVPLFLSVLALKNNKIDSNTIEKMITRVDDMSELLALYWNENPVNEAKNKKGKRTNTMVAHKLQKALSSAFHKFDEYQFAKYKGNSDAIKLKDVLFLARPKPENENEDILFKKIINNNLSTPDTWEVSMSAIGSDTSKKADEWTRLLTEKVKLENGNEVNKLGALALLRNLRNMRNVGVTLNIIREALSNANMTKILPFQIITSARYNPELSDILETKLFESISSIDKLKGNTLVLVDVSGSMSSSLSSKGETTRCDAGAGVAAILKELTENICEINIFNTNTVCLPNHERGLSLVYNISNSLGGGTAVYDCTNKAIYNYIRKYNDVPNRVVVITDEQSNSDYDGRSLMQLPHSTNGYIINVAPYANGVNYNHANKWIHISGWSENIIKFISAFEYITN